jgi:hypothetical protein
MAELRIAYFITSHGFGHASRACAVMQSLQKSIPDIHFYLYTTIPDWFVKESGIVHYNLQSIETDIGLLQTSPFDIDFPSTLIKLSEFQITYGSTVDQLCSDMLKKKIDFIICDVAAMGISVADCACIPSFLIENFTWDWIYDCYKDEYPEFDKYARRIKQTLTKANHRYLTEPFCQYPRSLRGIAKPISRSTRQSAKLTREQLNIPESHKIILLSMGGIPDQIQINASSMNKPNITYIVPGIGETIQHIENTIFLPHHSNFYHPDLVHCADAIIAKVGYSTIAEAYAANIPMGYIPRYDFPESKFLSSYIEDKLNGVEIKLKEFLSGRWVEKIDVLLSSPLDNTPHSNGADQIRDWIFQEMKINP